MKVPVILIAIFLATTALAASTFELNVYSPTQNYKTVQGTDSLFVQAAVFQDGRICSDTKLQLKISNSEISKIIYPGVGNIFRDSLNIKDLPAGDYVLSIAAYPKDAEIKPIPSGFDLPALNIKQISFTILSSEETEQTDLSGLILEFISPQQKSYASNNILVRVQLKETNGMIPEEAEVLGTLYLNNKENSIFQLSLTTRYFEKKLILPEKGNYTLSVKATYNGKTTAKQVNFEYGDIETTPKTSGQYAVFLTVASPAEKNSYSINELIPFYVLFKDTNGLFVDGTVRAEIYDAEDKKIGDTQTLSRNRQYYTMNYKFSSEGVYRILFKGISENLQEAQKTRLVYVNVNTSDLNKLNVEIKTPKKGVYPEEANLVARARLRYSDNEPVINATVVAIVNEFEYTMTYDSFGEYLVKLPMLAEGDYVFSVAAKEGELIGQASSEFKISKHRLNLQVTYPGEEQIFFLKRDMPMTFSFDVFDETGDITANAEVTLKIIDPEQKQIDAKIYQNDEGKYTGIVYLDKRGLYTYTATAEKTGYVADSVDSEFQLDIEDIYVFGIELEVLLNIILVIAILILIAGFIKGVF